MGYGMVSYELSIPFQQVTEKCDAYTYFDHVGGWNHSPALKSRKEELQKLLRPNEDLNISDLKIIAEGLHNIGFNGRTKTSNQIAVYKFKRFCY